MSVALDLALRRNKGRALRKRFLADLAVKLGRVPMLLSLETTDSHFNRFQSKWNEVVRDSSRAGAVLVVSSDRAEISNALNSLATKLPDEDMVLFRSQSQYCGAVSVRGSELLNRSLDLVSLDQEDVLASNHDATCGFVLEYFTDRLPEHTGTLYKLLVWAPHVLAMSAAKEGHPD